MINDDDNDDDDDYDGDGDDDDDDDDDDDADNDNVEDDGSHRDDSDELHVFLLSQVVLGWWCLLLLMSMPNRAVTYSPLMSNFV